MKIINVRNKDLARALKRELHTMGRKARIMQISQGWAVLVFDRGSSF